MLKGQIGITTWFGYSPIGTDWEEDIRRAFAKLGWTVISIGPAQSATHPEEDWIELRSNGPEMVPATLANVLTEHGLTASEYSFDYKPLGHKAETFVTDKWWDACADPRGLLAVALHVGSCPWLYGRTDRLGGRKPLLVACAAARLCTRSWGGKAGPILDVLERYVDGAADAADLVVAVRDAALERDAYPFYVLEHDTEQFWQRPALLAQTLVCHALGHLRRTRGEEQSVSQRDAAWESISDRAKAEVAAVVRDVLGNPLRPTTHDPSWLSWNNGTVPHIARVIYQERAFDQMPVLADALEEGGCVDAPLLAHCRAPGSHVRGCWVVDLILSKDR
jgi:hypothetical protein